jgi:hypothetical protein
MTGLFLFLAAHPVLMGLALIAGIVGFIVWLVKPPTWKDLDESDFAYYDNSFWVRLWGGRGWFRWW